MYVWSFSTGTHSHSVPDDNKSDSILNIPIANSEGQVSSGVGLTIESIIPEIGASRVLLGKHSFVVVGNLTFKTKERTDTYNTTKVSVTTGALSGQETINIIDNTITIEIEEGVTTNQDIINLVAASSLSTDLSVESLTPTGFAIVVTEPKQFSEGVNRNSIKITFSEEIDANSISDESIKGFSEGLLSFEERQLNLSYSVNNKTLTIKIED